MKTVLIAGGSGLIGQHLSKMLEERSYKVIHLSRRLNPNAKYKRFKWNVDHQTIDDSAVEQADYIINLAGAGIVGSRWTERRKKIIIEIFNLTRDFLEKCFILKFDLSDL